MESFLELIEPWIYAGGLAAALVFIVHSVRKDYFNKVKTGNG